MRLICSRLMVLIKQPNGICTLKSKLTANHAHIATLTDISRKYISIANICTGFVPLASEMKILVYFLSLSILLLSCITCEDRLEVDQNKLNKAEITRISESHNVPDDDNCSPLCTCNCCGQPAVNINNSNLTTTLKVISSDKVKSGYQSRTVTEFSRNIWQPPKLNNNFIG